MKKLTLCAILCTSFFARAGGWVSGGGNNIYSDFDNPWFLGEEAIEYCIDSSNDFPIKKEVIKDIIKESFNDWKQVFQRYGLYRTNLPGIFKDNKKRSITVDAREVETCTNPKKQLRFNIGIINKEINEYFISHSKQSIGLAIRKDYDHKDFRTGGIIWVAPKNWIGRYAGNGVDLKEFPIWNKRSQFKAIILHELGHVFGIPSPSR